MPPGPPDICYAISVNLILAHRFLLVFSLQRKDYRLEERTSGFIRASIVSLSILGVGNNRLFKKSSKKKAPTFRGIRRLNRNVHSSG
jgi:hypothetical protein